LDSAAIRQSFIDYFVENGHLHLPGLPLVPNDPSITTLFTVAGMQQMIPYFLGRERPPAPNMITIQKTIRTNDIEEVGDDTHCTFFEMMGNFSVGSADGYFKREAIAYTWDFITRVMGIPADRCWAVTYPGDVEARDSWLAVGLPEDRIGETDDNFWGPAGGVTGPCGPNSEIHYDRGLEYGCGRPGCRPENECCDRFVEVWNDVFMMFDQKESGERVPLPWFNVDTGMGFERLTMVVQGARSIFETDLYQPIISRVASLAGKQYESEERADRSLRIIADHSRAVAFLIADGVMPSADGRGYVLRRLLRRAALHGRLLGIQRPFLVEPIQEVIAILGEHRNELRERESRIQEVVVQEERRFVQTLSRGLGIFEEMAERSAATGKTISGQEAFLLSDTYGFPLELTIELAQERGVKVDSEEFEKQLETARSLARGRAARRSIGTSPETYTKLEETVEPTRFTGYDELRTTTEITAMLAGDEPLRRAEAGDEVQIILAATPFYAESGGQVGDTGAIRADTGVARVTDTQRPFAEYIVHSAEVIEGSITIGDAVEAEVNAERRLHILPHHSGTHLLHKALQEVLGPDAKQAGSLVAPDHFRFDFTWPRPLTDDELREVQDRVNAAIWANLPVRKEIVPYDEAIREGAIALFGEKYGDLVRMVSMGDWSKELCAGTHVGSTGDIGLLVITSETGSSSGVRRIEALAGAAAYAYVTQLRERLHDLARVLDTQPENLFGRAEHLTFQVKEQEKRIAALTQQLAEREAEALASRAETIGDFKVVAARIRADGKEYLHASTDAVKARLERGIVVLAAASNGSVNFTAAVTQQLVDVGYRADAILREAAKQARGGAGGSPQFAQGGGQDASKIDAVLRTAVDLIRKKAEG
jgi:alanyl-tRNA synthetase